MATQELQNPADKYPRLPYKKQSQPMAWTGGHDGSASDHGEESYRGSGPPRRPKGSHHRRRFRRRTRGGYRLCPRGRYSHCLCHHIDESGMGISVP
jgi:hypothetical protein